MYYVYALRDRQSGRIYIGRTSDLPRRLKEHLDGKVWTTKRMASTTLIFYEAFLDKKDAIRRERYLKTSKGKASLKQIIRCSLQP